MEQIFALYDSDSFYTTRFMEYFRRRKEYNFVFHTFTRRDCLEEFLFTHSVEILLVGDQELPEAKLITNAAHVYKLSEDPREECGADYTTVYKYQPAQSLMNSILSDYYKKADTSKRCFTTDKVKIFSIFSSTQNPESKYLAWSLGLLLSDHHKVFFTELELLPVPLLDHSGETDQALSEFIYYLKENANGMSKIRELLEYNGNMATLTGISHASDILSLTKEDVWRWINELKQESDYSIVIFYLGVASEAVTEIMNLSDRVFVVNTGSTYEKSMHFEWIRQMKYSGINMEQEKYLELSLPKEENAGGKQLQRSELKNTAMWNYARELAEQLNER